jgi:translocation and assembly module TamB
MLKVLLTGTPIVELGGEGTRIHGGVTLVRGTLEVEGKRFDIEHGIVTFTGEPDNPTLVVTATWDAADGTHVIADYVGPLKSGKLTLHADPPRTQDEIVALIVFGSTEGLTPSSGSGGNGMTTTAIAEGASFATQPLNKAIDQLTHLDVRARIDTSGAAAKSEVEVQIAKGISAQVAYVFGLPPPGTAPDLTWLTLACRVSTHWSLDFTVGDHGSSIIDALWRVRY